MLSTSVAFRRAIAQSSKVLNKATVTLASGTVLELGGDDIMMGGATYDESVSSSSSFDVGSAIIGKFTITINNMDGRFSDYDFTGATVVPYVGVRFDDGTVEWLRKGEYGIEQPDSYGGTIALTCYDNMRKLEKSYSEVTIAYPTQLGNIVELICEHCGLTLLSQGFDNHEYIVPAAPDDNNLTCLSIISYAAQVSGNFAKCDDWGRLVLKWYDTDAIEGEDWIDGGQFDSDTPYSTGDTLDGGNFTDYSSGDTADGGTFGVRDFAQIFAWNDLTLITDDVVITGLRVVEEDGDGEDESGATCLYGSEGYVLELSDNPLIQYGEGQTIADMIGPRIVGMKFRPFEGSALGDPAIEAGDPALLTDSAGNTYTTYLTSVTYKAGGYEKYKCAAETPSRNSAALGGAKTTADVQARKAIKVEKTAREKAIEELSKQLSESSGLYMTVEKQPDGSSIYYMHDKPTLGESQIVWKLTAEALGISTDGGQTYPYGLSVDGNAILNKIYAIGINADYITTGCINSSADNGTSWDLVAGTFQNTIKSLDYKIVQGYSKTLSTDDAVWEDESQWESVIKEDGQLTYTGTDVVIKYPRYVKYDKEPYSTIEFYANKAMTINNMRVGFLEAADSKFNQYIIQDSMKVDGGISGSATITHYEAATGLVFSTAQSVTKGQLLCTLTFYWLQDPGALSCDACFNTDAAGGALRPCDISGHMLWQYRIEEWKRASIRIEMSPSVLFGLYEAYQPYWKYYDRVSGSLCKTEWGTEVKEHYVGGFTIYNGALRFVSQNIYLDGGARISNTEDYLHIGFPDYGGMNDLWFSKSDTHGAFFKLQLMTDACYKGENTNQQCSLTVDQDTFDIHCGNSGAMCYRNSSNAGLYFDKNNGIQVQSGQIVAIVNGTAKKLA